MRKMFTRLFGLTLLMYLASSLTVVKAQCTLDLDPLADANVVLLTDISTVCDGGNVQYMVTGYESDSTYYSFNGEGDETGAGFTLANTFTTVEGRPFVVQVRVGASCFTNVLEYTPEDSVVAMTLDTILVTHPRCAGDDGEITVVVGGTEDFVVYYVDSASVSWDPNGSYTAHDETQFLGIPEHKYYMGISSVNCSSVMWDSVTIAAAPVELEIADVDGTDPECIGGEGTVTVTGIAGGTPFIGGNYMVTVGDSTKLSTGATAMFMMPQGNYTATVVDSFGCELTSDSIAVLTDPAAITFDIEIVDVDCYGDTGAIHILNLNGPVGATFEASLGDGNWVGIAPGDTVIKLTGLTPGYYSVYVDNILDACDSVGYVNPNNTQNTVSVQAPGMIEFDVTVGTITCNGGTTTIAVSNEEGGSGTYEYQLEDENGVVAAFSATKIWTVPAADDYVVIVRDANATTCEISSAAYDITEPSEVDFYDIDVISPTCFDGTDGIINIDAEGGNGTYQYKLNDGQWKDNNVFSAAAGVYTVWVRDPLCPDQATSTEVEVVALAPNVLVLGLQSDTVNECYDVNANQIVVREMSWASQAGENRDLTVMITDDVNSVYVSGEEMAPWIPNTYRVVNVDPGTYYIWAVDNLGCVFDADQDGTADYITVTVIEPEELKVEGAVTDNATCYGENDGVMTIKHNGGGNDDWYGYGHANTLQAAMNLPNGAFTTWPTDADSVDINVVGDADGIDYYVVVMDDCGQKAYYGPLTVFGFDPVEIDAEAVSIKNIKCFGDTDGEIVVANATGGSGSLSYTLEVKNGQVWEEVEEWVDTDDTHYTGLGAGTYRVVVTDENGCAGAMTGDIIVEGPDAGVAIVDYDSEQISCFGAGDGEIYIEAAGGTGPYQFKAGASNWRDFPENSNEKVINILEPGIYTVIIRDAEMCESDPMEFTIYEPKEIQIDVQITDVTNTCDADNGQLVITVNGGEYAENETDFNVYVNGNEEGFHVEANEPVTVTGLGAGSHQIMVKENHTEYGCEQYATAVISAPDTVFAVAEVTQTVSCNGGNDGVILVSGMSGGTVADDYTVTISPSMGAVATTDTTVTFSGLEAGLYDITVTDDQECSYTMYDVAVVEPTMLTLNATKIQDITCAEGGMFSVQVAEGTPDYVYYTAKSDPVTGHVLVTDIPTPASNWQADSIFTVTEAGTWIVWAMDANECIIGGEEDENGPVNEWRVKIEALGTPDVAFTDLEVIAHDFCGDTTGVIGFSAVEFSFDGVPYATTYSVEYQEGIWNSTTESYVAGAKWASDSDTVSALPYRGYRFVLTDNITGCTVNSEWLTVDGNAPMVVTLEKGDGEFACPDATDGYIEATVVSGGEADYTYILYQDGDSVNTYTENSFLVPINSSYYVVVKDANDCMMASEVLVLDPVAPVVIEEIKDVTCSDDALASLKVTVSGEEGRQFQVKWRLYEETTEYTTAGMFEAGDIYLNEMFEFDNEEIQDKHYEIVVVDDMGCMSAMDTITIDQKPGSSIMLTTTVGEVNGCGTEVMVVAAGGVAPYSYMVNGEVAEGTTLLLGGGTHIIQAMDAHECMDADTITLAYPMSVDTTFNIFVGDTAHLVYGTIDEMFTEDVTATFYDMSDENCTVEVNVEVITREKTAPVLDTVSPMGTITDNHPTFVITFADDVTFNETGVLTVTEKDSANATLTLTITPEMVSGNTVTVTYDHTVSGGLDKFTTYVVAVDSGVVMGDGLVWDGNVPYAWEFTTGDFATDITDIETVEFKVYPNPFSSFIRIDNAQKLDRVIVSNIAGQRVLDIENPTYEIRTGNLVTGVYVVTLIANDEIVKSERIIKR